MWAQYWAHMYIVDVIHAHYIRSVVICFSLVMNMHLVSSNLEVQTFKHLPLANCEHQFTNTMLHFCVIP